MTRLETTTLPASSASPSPLESRTFNYFYDGMRRLRTANGPLSGSATTTQILQYRYDPIGNLREIESVPVAHAHPEKPHWPSARNGLAIEADPEGAIASRTVATTVQAFTHDSLGRPRQTGNLVHGYDWTSRRVRTQTTAASATILEPEPGYSYEGGRVNKHFFVAGRRVAASAKSWTAPSASAPVLWAPDWPRLPLPPPWAWGLAYAGALGGLLVLAGRRRGYGGASPGLRFASVAVLATVSPALLVGCPPGGGFKPFGSFGEAALFFVTDAVGSTVLAVRPDGSVRNRFLYRPYGEKIVNEGAGSPAMRLAHGFAGGAVLSIGPGSALYAFGPRLYDPSIGHFYQPDPLLGDPAAPQTMQPYGYALGDPLRLADPTGLFSEGGPVSSPPSFGVPSFRRPSGNGKGRGKPVNTASNVPPASAVGFQDAPAEPPLDQPVIFDPTEAAAGVLAGLIIGGPAGGVLVGVAGGLGRGTLRALLKRVKSLPKVTVSRGRFPESARHIDDAIAAGQPNVLTVDRVGATARRREALRGTQRSPGLDRDEFPPAMFREGGEGASVRPIRPGDNRGSGACIGSQCAGLPDGTRVFLETVE